MGKNGSEFETGRFDFLNASDPYHAYCQHLLAEVRVQNQAFGQQPTQPEDSADKEATPVPNLE